LTLLEGYQGTPVIEGVRVLTEAPLTVEVAVAGGVEEISLNIPDGPSRTTSHRPLGVRVRSRRGAGWVRDVRIGACDDEPGYVQTRIAAVNYAEQEVAVPFTPEDDGVFAVGRTIRIYNVGRSGLYRIAGRRREGDLVWLTLDHSALFARERVTGTREGQVTMGALSPVSPATADEPQGRWVTGKSVFVFAGGRIDDEGNFGGDCAFAGAWLGEGSAARQLRGATRSGTLVLAEPVDAGVLERDYGGKVVSVWEYGPGDRVEIALIEQ
jgi:hypothetical protein